MCRHHSFAPRARQRNLGASLVRRTQWHVAEKRRAMRNRNPCRRFYAKGLTSQARSPNCALRYEPWRGSAVRLLGVSSLNSGRAHARPFFFAHARARARPRPSDAPRHPRHWPSASMNVGAARQSPGAPDLQVDRLPPARLDVEIDPTQPRRMKPIQDQRHSEQRDCCVLRQSRDGARTPGRNEPSRCVALRPETKWLFGCGAQRSGEALQHDLPEMGD